MRNKEREKKIIIFFLLFGYRRHRRRYIEERTTTRITREKPYSNKNGISGKNHQLPPQLHTTSWNGCCLALCESGRLEVCWWSPATLFGHIETKRTCEKLIRCFLFRALCALMSLFLYFSVCFCRQFHRFYSTPHYMMEC